jgi:hypothetical protein
VIGIRVILVKESVRKNSKPLLEKNYKNKEKLRVIGLLVKTLLVVWGVTQLGILICLASKLTMSLEIYIIFLKHNLSKTTNHIFCKNTTISVFLEGKILIEYYEFDNKKILILNSCLSSISFNDLCKLNILRVKISCIIFFFYFPFRLNET